MPNFQPSGIIYIGNVPFTNNYLNVRLFNSYEEQETWMLSHMDRRLDNSTYTYVRLNNSIRIQGNAEDLYTYDYCMFKNANYGYKWFYAFIIAVNYINENCTEFVLQLDVMQTWMFEYHLRQGFVEREHTNDDTIGANLNTEPAFNYNTIIQSESMDSDFNAPEDYYIVLESTKWYDPDSLTFINNDPAFIQHIFNGSSYAGFDYLNQTTGTTEYAMLKNQLGQLNGWGYANNILSMFMFPKAYSPARGLNSSTSSTSIATYLFQNATLPVTKTDYFLMPDNLDGYTPRNNKLFTFPYCYPAFADINGNFKEYKFELWTPDYVMNANEYRYVYYKQCVLDSHGEMYITPKNYDGSANNYIEAFIYKFENRLSWLYEGFNNWLAQNSMRLLADVVTSGIGVGANLYASSVAENIRNEYYANMHDDEYVGKHMANPPYVGRHASGNYVDNAGSAIRAQREEFAILSPKLQALNKIAGTTMSIANELYSASKLPNEKRGTSSGNGRFAYDINSYSARIICLQHQFAERLDSFFDRYGYATELVKIPNIRGRKSWNFVKMQNAAHYGNLPNADIEIINSIYNRGVTFWHIDDIGDYSQDNSIDINSGNSGSNNGGGGGIGDNSGNSGSENEGAGGIGDNSGNSGSENEGASIGG